MAVVGGAVICSVLTLCCVKYVTILTSSIVGTAMILGAIDFFMHDLETFNWVSKAARLSSQLMFSSLSLSAPIFAAHRYST